MANAKLLSRFRKLYQNRLAFRITVAALTVVLLILAPGQFEVLSGFGFFRRFSVLHLLWAFWMADMILQLIPSKAYWPLGSQKFFKASFQPLKNYMAEQQSGLLRFIYKSNADTLRIGLVWLLLTVSIGVLHFTGVLHRNALLMMSVVFYMLDLVFVLYWCPFRVWFMKNRCCTTCRIFNWDHMMMFSPVVFIPGVYTWSLCAMALAVFFVWEITFSLHPERFWEGTNTALKCSNCTDRLCGERNCRKVYPDLHSLGKKGASHE